MKHHHISTKSWQGIIRSIDIYLDNRKDRVLVVDTLKQSNKIVISGSDWNELVRRIRARTIGMVRG